MDEVQVLSPAPRTTWRRMLVDDAMALPEQSPDWVDALVASGKYRDASRHYTFADGREFIMPLVRRRGVQGIGGWLQSYPPGWGMGGILGEQQLDCAAARLILDDLQQLKVQRVAIRPNPLTWSVWEQALESRRIGHSAVIVPRYGHVADISAGMDELWTRFSKVARRAVRNAQKNELEIATGRGGELLEQYYALFLQSVERWASQQHEPPALARARAKNRDPLEKLKSIGEHLGDNFVVTLALSEGRAIAGTIVLLGPLTAHETRGAMDRDAVGSSGAGSLLKFTTLQLACQHGCQSYHMGESGESLRIARFKEKFAATGHDYAEIHLDRLPWTRMDIMLRTVVKKILRFKDV